MFIITRVLMLLLTLINTYYSEILSAITFLYFFIEANLCLHFCLINICSSLSDEANKIDPLNIERT